MTPSRVVAVAVVAVGVASVVKGFGFTREIAGSIHAEGAALTAEQRAHAPGDAMPLPMDRFDFWRSSLRGDDRYWLDVNQTGFGRFLDLPSAVAALARFYLLPATQAASVDDATVVLSWDADPARLGLRFSDVRREGLQLVFASRLAR
jgi:hypothetical protein